MLIDVKEVFVVQSRPRAELPAPAWRDEREFDEDGLALDWADYLREDGDTDARVVCRWR